MEYFLYGAVVLAVGAVVAAAIYYRAVRRGGTAAENELRAQVAGLQAQAAERQAQAANAESQARDLQKRLSDEFGARRAAEASLAAERKNLAEQKALLDEAQKKLKDAFAALSAEALKDSRIQFLGQADEKLRPIQNLLKDYEQKLDAIEKARNTAYGGLQQHLDGLREAQQVLQKEAQQLATALRNPAVRGRWGELQLRRVLEMANMSDHFDFGEQETQPTEEGRQRPDVTIKLPNGRQIPVDSKAPLDAYLDAYEAPDEKSRETALDRHAQAIRNHMRSLSGKAYWESLKDAPDFVVLFLPGESFFAAALKNDPTLFEEAIQKRVVITTPMTLYALLRAVAVGWQEKRLAENAERIGQAGKDLYDRLAKFVEHFSGIGDALSRAGKAFDAAVGSYQSRIQPAARRLAEQAAVSDKELPDVPPVDGPTRALPAPDGESQAEGG